MIATNLFQKIALFALCLFYCLSSQAKRCLTIANEVYCFEDLSNLTPTAYDPYGSLSSVEIDVLPTPKRILFSILQKYEPTFTIAIDESPTDIVFSRWTPFREVNLAKKGHYAEKPEGALVQQDLDIINGLDEVGKNIVNQHMQFRIKNFAIAWEEITVEFLEENLVYTVPFYAEFMFHRSQQAGSELTTTSVLDQGSQRLLGTLEIQIDEQKSASIEIEFYDESNYSEELGKLLMQELSSEKEIQQWDKDRIIKAVYPALEMQLNLQIDQLLEDLEKSDRLNYPDSDKHWTSI